MSDTANGSPRRQAAGAFDVRNVIAALVGFYGVVLIVVGLFGQSDEDLAKTGGSNANLWVGLAMVVFAASFAIWSRVRPIVVEAPSESAD
jgi:hypothetical protein